MAYAGGTSVVRYDAGAELAGTSATKDGSYAASWVVGGGTGGEVRDYIVDSRVG